MRWRKCLSVMRAVGSCKERIRWKLWLYVCTCAFGPYKRRVVLMPSMLIGSIVLQITSSPAAACETGPSMLPGRVACLWFEADAGCMGTRLRRTWPRELVDAAPHTEP